MRPVPRRGRERAIFTCAYAVNLTVRGPWRASPLKTAVTAVCRDMLTVVDRSPCASTLRVFSSLFGLSPP